MLQREATSNRSGLNLQIEFEYATILYEPFFGWLDHIQFERKHNNHFWRLIYGLSKDSTEKTYTVYLLIKPTSGPVIFVNF